MFSFRSAPRSIFLRNSEAPTRLAFHASFRIFAVSLYHSSSPPGTRAYARTGLSMKTKKTAKQRMDKRKRGTEREARREFEEDGWRKCARDGKSAKGFAGDRARRRVSKEANDAKTGEHCPRSSLSDRCIPTDLPFALHNSRDLIFKCKQIYIVAKARRRPSLTQARARSKREKESGYPRSAEWLVADFFNHRSEGLIHSFLPSFLSFAASERALCARPPQNNVDDNERKREREKSKWWFSTYARASATVQGWWWCRARAVLLNALTDAICVRVWEL